MSPGNFLALLVLVALLIIAWSVWLGRDVERRVLERLDELDVFFDFGPGAGKTECLNMGATTTTLKTGQSKVFRFGYKKRDGSAARVDGAPTLRVQADGVCEVELLADEPLPEGQTPDPNAPQLFRGRIKARAAGPVRVYIDADADLGQGVSRITHHFDVVVTDNDEASEISVEFDEAVNEPVQP